MSTVPRSAHPTSWLSRTVKATWRCQWQLEIFVLLLASAVIVTLAPLNHDVAWYLLGGKRVLEGDRLYIDLFDVNPPLVFWMMALPAYIGQHVHVSDAKLVHSFTAALLLTSGFAGIWVLRLSPAVPRIAASAIVSSFALSITLAYPAETGQREQIAGILMFPYVLLAGRVVGRVESPTALSIVCGTLGGIGVALKPFFLAPWLAVELTVLLLRPQIAVLRRVEIRTVLLIVFSYAVIVITVTPEYLIRVGPLIRETYGAFTVSWLAIATSTRTCGLLLVAVIGLLLPWLFRRTSSDFSDVLGAATVGFVASYVVQRKGWDYQLVPALAFGVATMVATVVQSLTMLRGLQARTAPQRLRLLVCGVVALSTIAWAAPSAYRRLRYSLAALNQDFDPSVGALTQVVSRAAVGEPVYFMSTSVYPAFPVVSLAEAKWPYHFNHLWPIPALYRGGPDATIGYRPPEEQSSLERLFFDTVVSDLMKVPPRLLIVESGVDQQAMRGRDFDFIKYFSGSADFKKLLQRYRWMGRIGVWDVYELTS